MHTLKEVKSADFEIKLNNKKILLSELFRNFDHIDRVGIVTRSHGGVLGASVLLMRLISAFYDTYRGKKLGNQAGKLRIYPEYFIFHVGSLLGSYGQLDIWPPHREVVIEDDTEQLLEAINDRGITRLLIEEGPEYPTTLLRETLSSAESRIVSLLYYSPNGKVANGDVAIENNGSISKFVLKAYEDCLAVLKDNVDAEIKFPKEKLTERIHLTQTYKRIDLEKGIRSLSHSNDVSSRTKTYIETSAHGAPIRLNN